MSEGQEAKGKLYIPEIEQQVLGNILNCNEHINLLGGVQGEWFHEPAHRDIFDAIAGMIDEGGVATIHSLAFRLKGNQAIAELGGNRYLANLVATSTPVGIEDLVKEMRNLWARRTLSEAMQNGLESIESFDQFQSPQEALDQIEQAISEVASIASRKPLVETALSGQNIAIQQMIDAQAGGGVVGTPTGLSALDRLVGGMGPGDMIVLAGRPSMGKTAMALAIAWNVARRGEGVFFGSLEMMKEQLWNRFFSAELMREGKQVPYFDIRTGRIDDETARDVVMVAKANQGLPFLTGEKECRSLARLRAAARRAKSLFEKNGTPLGCVMVDYLQLIEGDANDYRRVSQASNALKALAVDLGVPVVALSQLNRGVETRDPPVPRLSDLRESGKIEEDADTVILVYREAYYLRKKIDEDDLDDEERELALSRLEAVQHRCNLLVPKARGGPTGKVDVGYMPEYNHVWSLL